MQVRVVVDLDVGDPPDRQRRGRRLAVNSSPQNSTVTAMVSSRSFGCRLSRRSGSGSVTRRGQPRLAGHGDLCADERAARRLDGVGRPALHGRHLLVDDGGLAVADPQLEEVALLGADVVPREGHRPGAGAGVDGGLLGVVDGPGRGGGLRAHRGRGCASAVSSRPSAQTRAPTRPRTSTPTTARISAAADRRAARPRRRRARPAPACVRPRAAASDVGGAHAGAVAVELGAGRRQLATAVRPSSSSTTTGVRGRRCSCSTACRPRASSSAVCGRFSGFLAIACASSRSSETGTSARPVGGTGTARIAGHQGVGGVVAAGLLERRAADEEVPQRRGEGVDVAAGVAVGLAVEDLGRRPRHRDADVLVDVLGVAAPPGDAEVGEAGLAVLADQDVGRLDVAVDDAGPVRGLDRARELDAGAQHLLDGHPLGPRPHREVRRRVVLHDEVGAAVGGLLGAEDLRRCRGGRRAGPSCWPRRRTGGGSPR